MKNEKYHFIGIGGIGMGALASLVLDKGGSVSGSDLTEGRLTSQLKERGAKISIGHDGSNIEEQDFVIYSSAIKKDNPELLAAKEQRIPILRRAELLAQLMKGQESITVAGAHGKTTTTSLISHILQYAGLNPSTAIGGIVYGGTASAQMGTGDYFVSEVDESDGTFLNFHPKFSVITNIDLEHVDYYHNWDNVIQAYKKFIGQTKKGGCLIVCAEDRKLMDLVNGQEARVRSYGFGEESYITAKNCTQKGLTMNFDCWCDGVNLGLLTINIPGKYNVLNTLAAVCLALEIGLEFSVIKEALENFAGVKRRFDCKGVVDQVTVVDDYAHHPSEIKAVLDAAANMEHDRLLVVVQPHRFSRLQFLMDEFVDVLKQCEHLYITDVYAASECGVDGVDSLALVKRIQSVSKGSVHYVQKEELCETLLENVHPKDLVLTLGAGDITYIAQKLCDRIKERVSSVAVRS